ncbi:3-oxoacyl-ACP synthase [Mesorhizobium sp. M2E.F.Ca.ET.219.01.1.1]|uniref:3-oxoacyl-ACP synthase n=1 Tax=Mesorhizobium sp. M2E.F.Ca.ET.219.01.1.1 TaxID=2500530 RepID=UPI000FD6DAA5|nr:3-oxoacyl-ACP synthase [Mesorhizobium sp. M2E.F.Ca.ET.219.01.1.1]TGQ05665.1 3-oxoacyl-ACP synthase [Mesorhizobium sp. M2E.F.Ca.ET.219.01.1.1]
MTTALEIASVGMVTSVGLDAPSACAAMRAGIDGFQETHFLSGPDEALIGAPIPLPRGWIGEKRFAHLAAGAICEALQEVPEARREAVVILCLPEESRPGRPVRDVRALVRSILEIAEVPQSARLLKVSHGRPSGHVALEQARRILAANEAPFVLIAGVDSYLTTHAVEHYLAKRRLLTLSNPDGFIPGEAAAAILCTKAGPGRFSLFGLGLSREKSFIYNEEDIPLRGDGIVEAYRGALNQTGIEMNGLGYRISDLIGEAYFFKQTALASIRLVRGHHGFQDLWSPAESLGNVGASVVPLMIGMAWTAARKGYAAGNPVLVEASNDQGACGAAVFGVGAIQ